MQAFINQPPRLLGTTDKFPKASLHLFAKEPSLVTCDSDTVFARGGELAKAALLHVQTSLAREIFNAKQAGLSPVIDVRVHHFLGKGTYPAAPGWHCDGIPRSQYTGEYNINAIHPRAFNVAVTLSSERFGVSCTEFLNEAVRVKLWEKDRIYKDIQEQLEKMKPSIRQIEDGTFVQYSPKAIHRAAETSRSGMRVYFRYSMLEKPSISNTLTTREQVYLLSAKNGW